MHHSASAPHRLTGSSLIGSRSPLQWLRPVPVQSNRRTPPHTAVSSSTNNGVHSESYQSTSANNNGQQPLLGEDHQSISQQLARMQALLLEQQKQIIVLTQALEKRVSNGNAGPVEVVNNVPSQASVVPRTHMPAAATTHVDAKEADPKSAAAMEETKQQQPDLPTASQQAPSTAKHQPNKPQRDKASKASANQVPHDHLAVLSAALTNAGIEPEAVLQHSSTTSNQRQVLELQQQQQQQVERVQAPPTKTSKSKRKGKSADQRVRAGPEQQQQPEVTALLQELSLLRTEMQQQIKSLQASPPASTVPAGSMAVIADDPSAVTTAGASSQPVVSNAAATHNQPSQYNQQQAPNVTSNQQLPTEITDPFASLPKIKPPSEVLAEQAAKTMAEPLRAPSHPHAGNAAKPALKSAQQPSTARPSVKPASDIASRTLSKPQQPGSRPHQTGNASSFERQTPLLKRIMACTSWADLKRFAAKEQKDLDTFHSAALLGRLAVVVEDLLPLPAPLLSPASQQRGTQAVLDELPGPIAEEANEARVLASELAALLTLQMSILQPATLAAVVMTVGQLRATPKWTSWADKTVMAIERASNRLSGSEQVSCALGLGLMRAQVSSSWMTRFWADTKGHMQAGRLGLQDLANLAEAVAEFQTMSADSAHAAKPIAEWQDCWKQAVQQAALPYAAGQQTENASRKMITPDVTASIALASYRSGMMPQPDLIQSLFEAAAQDTANNPEDAAVSSNAGAVGLSRMSGLRLAELAPALVALKVSIPPAILDAYIQVLWSKLFHIPPAAAITAFNALAQLTPQLPAGMLDRFLSQITNAGSNNDTQAAAMSSVPVSTAGQTQVLRRQTTGLWPGSLATVPVQALVNFLVAFDKVVTASSAQGAVDANAVRTLQQHIAGLNWKDLDPSIVVAMLSALVSLTSGLSSQTDTQGRAAHGASHALHIEQSLMFTTYKFLKTRMDQLSPAAFAAVCSAVVGTGQVDLEFVESYLTFYLDAAATSPGPSALTAEHAVQLLQGLGTLAVCEVKARPGVLGPLLAKCVVLVPQMTSEQQLSVMSSMAAMKLTPKDTQGVRVTTTQGIPTPAEFIDLVLEQLRPSLPSLSFDQLTSLAQSVAATNHSTGSAWAQQLIAVCTSKLTESSVTSVVSLLSSLPAISAAIQDGQETAQQIQSFKEACIEKIGTGVAQLELDALADLMSAVATSRQNSNELDAATASFALAVMTASQSRLQIKTADASCDVSVLAQLTSSLAAVDALAPVAWLHALQHATTTALQSAREPDVAEIIWGIAKLVNVRRFATAELRAMYSFSDTDDDVSDIGVLASWHMAVNQRVTQQRIGQNDSFSLVDLAHLMWGCASLGITPRQGLLNSFSGKSMDRLSSMPVSLAFESAWAMARHGFQLGPKWINQWAVAVQGPTISRLSSEGVQATVWALGFHASGSQLQANYPPSLQHGGAGLQQATDPSMAVASTPAPQYIMSQLSARLDELLAKATAHGVQVFTSRQVAHMSATLASLGHTPSSSTAAMLAETGINSQLPPGELAALLWSQACFSANPKSTWLESVTSQLQQHIDQLSAQQLSRVLWSLASLPSYSMPAQLIPACIDELSRVPTTALPEQATTPDTGTETEIEGSPTREGSPGVQPEQAPTTINATSKANKGRSKSKKHSKTANPNSAKVDSRTFSTSSAAAALAGSGIAGLLPGDIVDAIWAVVKLEHPVPQGWWDLLPGKLTNRMNMLTAPQVSNLLWACAAAKHTLQPELANDLSKAAASRFASVPAPELADLVFSFARLGVPLPPAFASNSVRRLQSCMSGLPPRQLARMMWSFAKSGFTFLPQQLDAYQSRVIAVCPSMSIDDLVLIVQSFDGLRMRPKDELLDALQTRSLALIQPMNEEADSSLASSLPDPETNEVAVQGLLPLLSELSRSGRPASSAWLAALGRHLTSETVQQLPQEAAMQLIDAMSEDVLRSFSPSPAWCTAVLNRIAPAVAGLEAKRLMPLLRFISALDAHLAVVQEQGEVDTELLAYAAARMSVVGSLPALLSAKLTLLDTNTQIRALQYLASLNVPAEPKLIERMVEKISGSVDLLTTEQEVVLCSALYELVKLAGENGAISSPATAQGSDEDEDAVMKAAITMCQIVHPLHNKLLLSLEHRMATDQRLSSEMLALTLTAASQFNQLISGFNEDAPHLFVETFKSQPGVGSGQNRIAKINRLRTLDRTSGSDLPLRPERHIVAATQGELNHNMSEMNEWHKQLAAREETKEYAEHLASLPGYVYVNTSLDYLWLSDMTFQWRASLARPGLTFKAVLLGLAALERLGVRQDTSDYSQIMECAAKALPHASIQDCCSLAALLARAQVVPEEQWLRSFMDTLQAALSAEIPDVNSASSTWVLTQQVVEDLVYAMSFWAPSVSNRDAVSKAWDAVSRTLGGSGSAFPVNASLGASLLRSVLLVATTASTDSIQVQRQATELVGRMCLLSAAQGGRGVPVTDAWLAQTLQSAVLPACAAASNHPFVTAMYNNMPGTARVELAMEELLLAADTWAMSNATLDVQALVVLLEGLKELGRGMPKQPAGLQAALLEALLASAAVYEPRMLTRALLALYNLKVKPSQQWMEQFNDIRNAVTSRVQEELMTDFKTRLDNDLIDSEDDQQLFMAKLESIEEDGRKLATWLEALAKL